MFGYSLVVDEKGFWRPTEGYISSSWGYVTECIECIERGEKLGDWKGVLDLCRKYTEWLRILANRARRLRQR